VRVDKEKYEKGPPRLYLVRVALTTI